MIVLFSVTTLAFAWMVFVSVILLLSMMLIQARKKLVPQGNVSIVVNGDTENPLQVQPGSSLLTVLSGENIFPERGITVIAWAAEVSLETGRQRIG